MVCLFAEVKIILLRNNIGEAARLSPMAWHNYFTLHVTMIHFVELQDHHEI